MSYWLVNSQNKALNKAIKNGSSSLCLNSAIYRNVNFAWFVKVKGVLC